MRFYTRVATLVITGSLLSLSGIDSMATVKAGATCKKVGLIKKSSGVSYKCVKAKNKLIWKKSTSSAQSSPTPSPTPSPTYRDWVGTRSTDSGYLNDYQGWVTPERDLSGKLKDIESVMLATGRESGIYRMAKYELGVERPKSSLTNSSTDLPIGQCQISEPKNSRYTRGFPNLFELGRREYFNRNRIPGPKMVIQVIPIYASDTAKPIGSPRGDYDVYLDFLEQWAKYSSDGESNIQVRVPGEYLNFSKKVTDYALVHTNPPEHPEHVRFVNDLLVDVDPKIDFTGANLIIVIVPPGTPLVDFQQAFLKNFDTKEGRIEAGSTKYPLTLEQLNSVKFSNFLQPFWWAHELYHVGLGLEDHYGDGKNDVNSEYGLGWWTMMTPNGGDLSAWEKWMAGFITDSQVHCLSSTAANTRWIAPSSVKTKEKKLIVIPLSQTKGIIIESIRPAGLYYKIPKESNGVLVYVADLEIFGTGLGLKLVLPTNRNPNLPPFFLSQATLRQGESVITNGVKISILESGNFGDVIKVEKTP